MSTEILYCTVNTISEHFKDCTYRTVSCEPGYLSIGFILYLSHFLSKFTNLNASGSTGFELGSLFPFTITAHTFYLPSPIGFGWSPSLPIPFSFISSPSFQPFSSSASTHTLLASFRHQSHRPSLLKRLGHSQLLRHVALTLSDALLLKTTPRQSPPPNSSRPSLFSSQSSPGRPKCQNTQYL